MPKKKTALKDVPVRAKFIKFGTIKNYINKIKKMWSTDKAVKRLLKDLDATIEAVIAEAARLAKENKRRTVMEKDIVAAIENLIGKKHLTWEETVAQVLQQNPTDLGKISKAINGYIEKRQKEK